jgi:hypothetical protein
MAAIGISYISSLNGRVRQAKRKTIARNDLKKKV